MENEEQKDSLSGDHASETTASAEGVSGDGSNGAQNPDFSKAKETQVSSETLSPKAEDTLPTREVGDESTGKYIASALKEDDPEYVKDLVDRIHRSGFAKTRITHSDYKAIYRQGFTKTDVDGAPLQLKTGELLVVDTTEGLTSGSYWEVKE